MVPYWKTNPYQFQFGLKQGVVQNRVTKQKGQKNNRASFGHDNLISSFVICLDLLGLKLIMKLLF